MSELDKVPELREILGSMVFAAKRPVSISEMRRCLKEVAEQHGKETAVFADVKASDIRRALQTLEDDLSKNHFGFKLQEVAGGYRLQSDAACGRWLRHLLASGKPSRLSRPALETLAIIAYRQPITRSEIEGVRGVSVDHVIKTLMEMQLVRIVGRSDLPGRPLLYGTTHAFLEHFGLKRLKDLDEMEPMLLMGQERAGKQGTTPSAAEPPDTTVTTPEAAEETAAAGDDRDAPAAGDGEASDDVTRDRNDAG